MIHVIATVRVKADKREFYLQKFKANLPNVLAEKGCVEYFAAVDVMSKMPIQSLDENVVSVLEKWESLDCLRDHAQASHMQTFLAEVKDIVEDLVIKIVQEV